MGVDPGVAVTGYGVVRVTPGGLEAVDYGVVRTAPDLPEPLRLQQIYRRLRQLLGLYGADAVAMEILFFNRNVQSAMAVGQGRGVAMLAAADEQVPVAEYSPQEVKLALTGVGSASKAQVGYMVRALLRLDRIPRPDDAADALAVAICHAHRRQGEARGGVAR